MDRKPSRKDRLREIQREAILDAAEEVFATEGFHRAKMRNIAEKADFAAGSLYNYFSSKEDIFLSLMERRMDVLYRRLKETMDSDLDFIHQVFKLAAIHVAFMDEHRSFFTIFVSMGLGADLGLPVQLGERAYQQYRRYAGLIEELINRGIHERVLREIPTGSVSSMLMGMINAAVCDWCREPAVSFARKWPLLIELFFNGARRDSSMDAKVLAGMLCNPDELEREAMRDLTERHHLDELPVSSSQLEPNDMEDVEDGRPTSDAKGEDSPVGDVDLPFSRR